MVSVYEGWDAAGKGGNIKRLAGALDARGYEVVPIAAPSRTRNRAIICGAFGRICPKQAMSRYLTAAGTGVLW